ncbi:CdiA family toxin C-terminal domain-containing protein [Erwinia sp. PsM31]|nr:CdiA family toxin C-terminal domain-containing protein [Erwinia sp. PsM31]MDN4629770.1 CdiA family toxin C-terminal domain-containing protein [Erwinia sp. PsM31]
MPPSAWKSGEGEFSLKPDKTVTNVEYPGGQYDGNSLPYKTSVEKGTTTITYPDGVNFRIDQPKHLATVDGFTQKNGISGGHNSNAFYDAAKEYNVKIVSETPTGVKGITEVKYLIPTKDRAGNLTGDYKATPETKTIYDPKIFSDHKILELGQQAAASGYKEAMSSPNGTANVVAGGVSFRIYVDKSTGTVRNFHPN